MKKFILFVLLIVILTGCDTNIMKISNSIALDTINNQKNILLLDVRTKEEYDVSHIEGSINIPHTELEEIENLINSKEYSKILIYCRSGNRSNIVSQYLVEKGYDNIYNMSEGFMNWKDK